LQKRTLALRETSNSKKQLNKKKKYNKILEMTFVLNLQIVSMACCRSSLSRSEVVGCGRKVAEQVKKTTNVLEKRKKE
jgi:hypothetical protein